MTRKVFVGRPRMLFNCSFLAGLHNSVRGKKEVEPMERVGEVLRETAGKVRVLTAVASL